MKSTLPEIPEQLADRRTRRGEIEGYLSLTMTALFPALNFLPEPRWPFGPAIGIAFLIFASAFGVSGIRSARGGGRVAGWLSVGILSLVMLYTFALTYFRFRW